MAKETKKKLTYHKGQPVYRSGEHRYVYKKGWGMVRIAPKGEKHTSVKDYLKSQKRKRKS